MIVYWLSTVKRLIAESGLNRVYDLFFYIFDYENEIEVGLRLAFVIKSI